MGWLIWKSMLAAAVLGFALVTVTIVILVWFLFDIGFAWIGIFIIGLSIFWVWFSLRSGDRFDIRR